MLGNPKLAFAKNSPTDLLFLLPAVCKTQHSLPSPEHLYISNHFMLRGRNFMMAVFDLNPRFEWV